MKSKRDKGMVLFVCTGNICRSPMAEYLLKARLNSDSRWEVCSAGVAAGYGMPASRSGVEVLKEMGINMEPHRSRYLDIELVRASDVIVVMAEEHRSSILMVHPEVADKIFLMKSFMKDAVGTDVQDPIGASMEVYTRICGEISEAMDGLIEHLRKLEEDKWGV